MEQLTQEEVLARRRAYFERYKPYEKPKRKKRVSVDPSNPLETEEQKAFVTWLSYNWYFFSALPLWNLLSKDQAYKNVAEGVNPWVPDILIILKNKKLLFVEMKRLKKGVVRPEQKEWIKRINECDGVTARVARWCKEAITIIQEEDV